MVYFLHDWFHSDFLNSFDVAQPLGDAIGTVIIVVVAYLAQRLVSIAFYRDMMFGLARNQEVFASTNTNYQAVAEEVAEELAAVPAFNEVLQGQLHSVIQATEEAAYQITERLQAVDGVVTHLNEFVSTSSTESSQMVNESESRIADNQKLIVEMGLYIENRIQEAQTDQQRVAQVVAEARSLESLTKLIKGIASQTNLLALNAAIEAARAGEHGRGFAVVAEEVRGLAGRTAEATDEVGQMIEDIQRQTGEVVEQIRQLTDDLGLGVNQVESTGRQLQDIAGLAATVETQITEIAEGAEINRNQLDSLFAAVEQVRGDLRVSDEQTHRLADAAVQLETQAEMISERLAEVALDDYHQRIYDLARAGAQAIGARFETDIDTGRIGQDDLFDRDYQPLPGTRPQKFRTRFDRYTDEVLPRIQEDLLQRHEGLVFAIACTAEGYVPTHNQAFSHPPSGDLQVDMLKSRSKRLFNDRTGVRCGSHNQPMLLQTYCRDTGELMHDLSVPIYVRGRQWGGLRLGYRPEV